MLRYASPSKHQRPLVDRFELQHPLPLVIVGPDAATNGLAVVGNAADEGALAVEGVQREG